MWLERPTAVSTQSGLFSEVGVGGLLAQISSQSPSEVLLSQDIHVLKLVRQHLDICTQTLQ